MDYESGNIFNSKYNLVTRKIVRALSENSRMSISDLMKSVGMSRMVTRNKMMRIEHDLGVHYTIEFNEDMLNVAAQHIISVKFDKKPDYDRIKKQLEKSYMPQLAFTIKGSYDLVIYTISASTKEYAHWDRSMQILLSEYGTEWKSSEVVHKHLGFCPLRPELLDRLNMPDKYRGMLKILNEDSRTPFRKIAKELKIHFNTVAYDFKKIMKEGYVKRFTITMDKLDGLSFLAFFSKFKPTEDFEKTSSIARKLIMGDDKDSLISKTILSANLIGSYDLFISCVFDNYESACRNLLRPYRNIYASQGIRTIYGEVDKMILGRLPIRSIDTTKEYSTIVWNPDFEEKV